MKILFFAKFRHLLGRTEVELEIPEQIHTVRQLIDWLKQQGPEYEAVFADERIVRAAVDKSHASLESSILGAKEIAFCPPVTGG